MISVVGCMVCTTVLLLIELPGAVNGFKHSSYLKRKSSSAVLRSMQPSKLQITDDIGIALYDAQLLASDFVSTGLSSTSVLSVGILYLLGLFSALSPCSFGMLPLTLAYLSNTDSSSSPEKINIVAKSASYCFGLASTFTVLGLVAALFGNVLGSSNILTQLGNLPQLLIAIVYVVLGLNMLEIIRINFPSLKGIDNAIVSGKQSSLLEAALFGGASALVATPCTSPILTALLTYVSTTTVPLVGALFLFIFSLGYATPVVSAGLASNSATTAALATGSPWVTNTFAALLIAYGSFECLNCLSTVFI